MVEPKYMKKVILVLVLVLCVGNVGAVSFTETSNVGTATPGTLSEDIRIEDPYAGDSEVVLGSDNPTKWNVDLVMPEGEKEVYINLNSTEIWGVIESDPRILVNGEEVNWEQQQHLGSTWAVFNTTSQDASVEITPVGGYAQYELNFLESPILWLTAGIFIVLGVSLLGQRILESETDFI